MLNEDVLARLAAAFPDLLAEHTSRRSVSRLAQLRRVASGSTLYHEGDDTSHLPLMLTGELAVTKAGESGREITLYRIGAGESCILSTLGILNRGRFPATAEVTEEGEVVLVPAATVRELIDRTHPWREFVFRMYHERLTTLITLVEEVVFQKLDVRLAGLLLRHTSTEHPALEWTHQKIAVELGSSREVISRVLKDWQRRELIDLARGSVRVRDRGGLADRADSVT